MADPHSFSDPTRVQVTHLGLDLELDFEAQRVEGAVTLSLARHDPEAPLILDVQGLEVAGVSGADGEARTFRLGDEVPRFGQPLEIELAGGDESVTVRYRTGQGASALQWLAPEQTHGGEHPFLFTQGQAVLTRSWIPVQDTPGVRVTYAARVTAPEGLTPVMSAVSGGRDAGGAYLFELDNPIPSYLIALGCGDLASVDISGRCAVWAEPGLVESAAWELADTEQMIQRAEELFGDYRWGRYDILILPPSFPYGGMENPLLTFLTPTVIAGDRSLVSIIAHELAHSWSGNLVTNATWSDFWLNEGTTVYFERRIMEELYGVERVAMEASLDMDALDKLIARQQPWENVLCIDLEGKHPDDGFSSVPYNMGAAFFTRLEEIYGRERFDEFLGSWFDEHAFQSVTTADFEAFLRATLLSEDRELAAQIDLQQWIHAPGLPDDTPSWQSNGLTVVDEALAQLRGGASPASIETEEWVTQQWLHFLENLPERFDQPEELAALDAEFGLTRAGNAEIACAWFVVAAEKMYVQAHPEMEEFLGRVGRRKFLQPIYEGLMKSQDGKAYARTMYARFRSRYHSVATGTLDGVVQDGE